VSHSFSALADALECDWQSLARPEQLPPPGDDWSVWLILAGRGAGKTRTGAEWVRGLAESAAIERIALVGPTAADTRDVMVEGESGLLSIAPNSFRPLYEPSKRRLTWPNGVTATMSSSEEPERLRGPQHGAGWLDELGAWRNVKETFDMLQFGLRLGKRPRQVITTTPKPIKLLRELMKRSNVAITRGSTYDNRANLAATFFTEIVRRYEGTRLGRQELNAELLDDVQGALWNRDVIEAKRLPAEYAEKIEFERIVVAIDPAISVSEDSDETGIIVAAKGFDERAYVLEDLSGKFSPTEWATRAIAAYRRWSADRIVAEINQGGEMVASTLRVVDPNVPLRVVHAKRGKLIRAEPVSALYEQGRVSHVGTFEALEDQLCMFAPGVNDGPDRLDAVVYALSDS
jgi:phage terminase large subunit-like protein